MQGVPVPLVDLRIVGEAGECAWNNKDVGELQVRGPTSPAYHNVEHDPDKFTDDGWLRTGDVAAVDQVRLRADADRTKDLIKSGGEWISSVDLENAIMAHPAVAEAAVIAAGEFRMASAKDVMKMVDGQRSQVRRLPLHRYARQGAARDGAGQPLSTRTSSQRARVRRLVDRRLEGHRGLRHAADAGSGTANMDPFREEPTLILTCDVVEPSDGKGYSRDPRSIAKRAEAYLKASGIGDTAFFGPEPEFFIFDSVTWNVDMSGCFVKINSEEAPGRTGKEFEGGNMGHRPASRAATSRCRRSTRSRTCVRRCACCSSRWACRSKCTTMKWPVPASARSAPSFARWCSAPTGRRS
jgi:hypothetical protein